MDHSELVCDGKTTTLFLVGWYKILFTALKQSILPITELIDNSLTEQLHFEKYILKIMNVCDMKVNSLFDFQFFFWL